MELQISSLGDQAADQIAQDLGFPKTLESKVKRFGKRRYPLPLRKHTLIPPRSSNMCLEVTLIKKNYDQ